MKLYLVSALTVALVVGISACSTTENQTRKGQPLMTNATLVSAQGTIVGVDYEKREVTLEVPNKPGDNFVNVTVSDDVKNLSQIRFGDRVTVEYIEAVFVDLFRAGDVDPGVSLAAAAGTAAPGERPGEVVAKAVSAVAVIESIDRANELVTLRGPKGGRKVVKVRNPLNLEKASTGDKVKVTFARGLAINVTPSPVR